MKALKVKNWSKFQHFKDRRPPWIKLYRDILDDVEWHALDPIAAKALVMIWLLASEAEAKDGSLPDTRTIAFRLHLSEEATDAILSRLSHWLEPTDINVTSERHQCGSPETETYKTEKEVEANPRASGDALARVTRPTNRILLADSFNQFWSAYPNKVGKAQAERSWKKINPDAALLTTILTAVEAAKAGNEWRKDGGQFIPHPATWLNGQRWHDELRPVEYSAAEIAVMEVYNEVLASADWSPAVLAPYSPERAAAIREFLTFKTKPDWFRGYFEWLRDNLPAKPGCGFEWSIKHDTILRAMEGNFAALAPA